MNTPVHRNDSPLKNLRRGFSRALSRALLGADAQPASTPLPARGIHRILICRSTRALGETLLLSPLLEELHMRFPGAEIDLASGCGAARDLFASHAQLRQAFEVPARKGAEFLRFVRRMRGEAYDLVIDPYWLSHSDRLLTRLAHARFRLGFDGVRKSGHLTHAVAEPKELQHAGKLPVYLLRAALGEPVTDDFDCPLLDLRLTRAERKRGGDTLAAVLQTAGLAGKPAIGIYAHATGPKCYDLVWWRAFLARIEMHYPDHAIVEIVPGFGRSLLEDRYPTFYSSEVRKLGALLSKLELYVSADCGIMHLASATGVPTVGIFSASDIPGWYVYGPHALTLDARGRSAEDMAVALIAHADAGKFTHSAASASSSAS